MFPSRSPGENPFLAHLGAGKIQFRTLAGPKCLVSLLAVPGGCSYLQEASVLSQQVSPLLLGTGHRVTGALSHSHLPRSFSAAKAASGISRTPVTRMVPPLLKDLSPDHTCRVLAARRGDTVTGGDSFQVIRLSTASHQHPKETLLGRIRERGGGRWAGRQGGRERFTE